MKNTSTAALVSETSPETPVKLGASPSNQWAVSASHVDMALPPPAPVPLMVAAEPQNITIDLKRTAMIVVDMQNDFCDTGGWCDYRGADIAPERAPIKPLQKMLPALRAAGVPIIWLNWGNRPDQMNIAPTTLHIFNHNGAFTGLGQPLPGNGSRILEKDSWGAAVVNGLEQLPGDINVDKYRISGFWDTPLDSILRNLGCTTLLFAGVNTDQCVMHSLTDASFLGYGCVLVEDCCGTTSPQFCTDASIWNVKTIFGFVTNSDNIVGALDDAAAK
jgi:nicotinamidase-related amidase